MQAILFDSKKLNELKLVKNQPIPKPTKDTEVVIKVAYAGVCGTDLHVIQGIFPCTDKGPFILGHEFSGTIVEVGSKAAYKIGQRVVVDPNYACSLCHDCHSGRYHLCGNIDANIGIFRNGGWAQYCVVPDIQVVALPDNINLEQAALTEPLSCLAHGWDRMAPVHVGEKILVIGAGIIGNLWAILLHLQGHRDVVVSEPNLNRLGLGKKMNLGYTYVTPDELKTANRKFDLIIDCTGVAKVFEMNFDYLGNGAKYVVFGCSSPADSATINPYVMYVKELTVIGVKVNPFSFPKALGFIASLKERYLTYENLGIREYKLADYEAAIEALKSGVIAKAIFKIE